MKQLTIVLIAVAALTVWGEPPPFVVLGSKEVKKTATGYQVMKPDGTRLEWTKTLSGNWTDGRQTYTPTPRGWNLRGKGEVFTRTPGYWSMRTTNGSETVFIHRNGLRLRETEYRYTAGGGCVKAP